MKQVESQKSISWFKLAEYVERGEKERALGIYKLLALSIDDIAFNYQLEGDILLAFDDQQALGKYHQALEQYLKQNNLSAAISTLAHILILIPSQKKSPEAAQTSVNSIIMACQKNKATNSQTKLLALLKQAQPNLHQYALSLID